METILKDIESNVPNAGFVYGNYNGDKWWVWIKSYHMFQGRTCFRSSDGKLYWIRDSGPSPEEVANGIVKSGVIINE
jgi:hypothetical protein